jgi:hypothetical protein
MLRSGAHSREVSYLLRSTSAMQPLKTIKHKPPKINTMPNDSIFEFADKFGYVSPFGNWAEDERLAREERNEARLKQQKMIDPKKGRIVFDAKAKQIYVNLLIVFYGTISEKEVTQQAGLIDFACNEMPYETNGPDGSKYPVCYNVNGIFEKEEFAVKQLMVKNHDLKTYDDRLCFARIVASLTGGPHNDDQPNRDKVRRGKGNSFIAAKRDLFTTSVVHEVVAHFFWNRDKPSHLTEWKDNPRKDGPPSIRTTKFTTGAPAKYYNTDGTLNQTMRKVLPEDKIQLKKEDWKGQNYIQDGVPTNTFFKTDGTEVPVQDFTKEVSGQ